jgi:hypothetical protein
MQLPLLLMTMLLRKMMQMRASDGVDTVVETDHTVVVFVFVVDCKTKRS